MTFFTLVVFPTIMGLHWDSVKATIILMVLASEPDCMDNIRVLNNVLAGEVPLIDIYGRIAFTSKLRLPCVRDALVLNCTPSRFVLFIKIQAGNMNP